MNGAEYIAQTLAAQGVSHVFLVPAILRRTLVEMEKLGISRITTHTEAGAAYMADGFARVSGQPAVAMAQSVGAANLAAALQDAYLGHSPVIALSGRKAPIYQHRNAYQEILHSAMYEPVTKANVCIDDATQLPFLLQQLFREATTGTPGPVHADLAGLSGEVIEQGNVALPVFKPNRPNRVPAVRPTADPAAVEEAMRRIAAARQPIIVAGGGAMVSAAHAEMLQLAEMLAIPIATSNDAKGIIAENHPLAAGIVGSYSQQCANRSVSEADLVIFIGCATGDQVTLDWTIPAVGTPVIQIDINPAEPGRNYPNALGLCGDVKTVVGQMLTVATAVIDDRREWNDRVRGYVREWRQLIEPFCSSDQKPIRPERLCREISDNLPKNVIVFSDTGYSCVWAGTIMQMILPSQRFIRAAGSLGWAFPASLGGKCAAPDRPVLCFCGDGAFLYHMSELETARRRGIHTVTVVNNNSYFGQSIPGMTKAYGTDSGKPDEIVQFAPMDYARIAQDFGCIGIRIEDPAEIAPVLKSAWQADRPVVIDVITSADCHPPTIWRPS